MDIEYLLWLQNFREASGNILTPFMQWVSDFTFGELFLIPLLMYWCINKRNGMFLLLSVSVSSFLIAILKMTFCVYRPFIRDARIIPMGHRPSGYSFPSGHSITVTAILGGCAVLERKKFVLSSYLCAVIILLVMFSRNYLGVHTPQDVIAGLIAGLAVLYAVSVMMSHPEHENMFMALGVLAVIAGIAYVTLKPYPTDLGANGKPLVNSAKKISDIYISGGGLAGLIAGRFIERKYVRFTPSGLKWKGIVLASVGCGIYSFVNSLAKSSVKFLAPFITERGGEFVNAFVLMVFVAAVWPFVIKKFCE